MIGNQPSLTNNVASKTISVTPTAGQTLFTVTGGYRINQISVYRNGSKLVDAQDYTARDGATVTLLSPANASDVLEFQVFDDFRVADALNVNSGGTVNGAVTIVSAATTALLVNGNARITGILTVGSSSITFDGTNNRINVGSVSIAETGITGGTSDIVTRNIIGVAATFTGNVSIGGTLTYEDVTNIDSVGLITARSGIVLTGGDITLGTGVTASGSTANTFTLSTNGSERLRVDSSGNINADSGVLYVDAVNNRVAVGSSSPQGRFESAAGDSTDYAIVANNSLSTGGEQNYISLNAGTTRIGSVNRTSNDIAVKANYGSVSFWTGTGGTATQKAVIDSSGRLLVGTSSARTNITSSVAPVLQVEGTNQNTSSLSLTRSDASTSSNPPFIFLTSTGGTTAGSNTLVVNNTTDTYFGAVSFCGTDGTKPVVAAQIDARLDGTPGANDMPGRLVFSTTADGASSSTERMRIGSTGRIDCISNDTSYTLNALTSAAAGTTVRTLIGVHSQNGYGTGTISFNVYSNGNVTNTNSSYTGISDIKLKENIVDAGSQWEDLKALQVRKYNFKKETGHQTHTQIGLIAQETELVSPGLVFESPDLDVEGNDLGTVTKSVNYSVLYMKAVKALQEAMERIETLEAKVAVLESA